MMHTLVETLGEFRHRTRRRAAFAAAVLVSHVLPLMMLAVSTSRVWGQAPSTRDVYVTVTDPSGRIVTGLSQQHF
jgi:hypothetical protein